MAKELSDKDRLYCGEHPEYLRTTMSLGEVPLLLFYFIWACSCCKYFSLTTCSTELSFFSRIASTLILSTGACSRVCRSLCLQLELQVAIGQLRFPIMSKAICILSWTKASAYRHHCLRLKADYHKAQVPQRGSLR